MHRINFINMGLTEETFPTILRAVGQQEKLTLMRIVDLTVYVQLRFNSHASVMVNSLRCKDIGAIWLFLVDSF